MSKRLISALLLLGLLTGCTGQSKGPGRYTATFLDLFDTVTTIVGWADSEEEFRAVAQTVHDELLGYHRLFDVYHDYEGLTNLKTINDCAGGDPVPVDGAVIELLQDCKDYYRTTDGRVNVAMGAVLHLWHEARTQAVHDPAHAALPDRAALEAAAEHCDPDAVVVDEAASTVCITDPLVRLDVGAVAKGWAVQRVAQTVPEGLLISVGGNVCATGPKDEAGTPWVVGIQNVDGSETYLHTVYVTDGCVVTSGDYQRYFVVGGSPYHHIIDPDTLLPGAYWRSVSVICDDSGTADALSTALFLLPQQEGQRLLERYGAQALWVDAQGEKYYSPGFRALIRT